MIYLLLAALMLALPLLGFAQQTRSGCGGSKLFTYPYTIDDLPNGLRLVTVPTDYPNLVSIYIVVEPRVGDAGAEASVTARAFRYRYPSGPTDAEALGVRPNGDLTIVSKGRSGTIDFYSIPAASVTKAIASSEIITAISAGNTGIQPDPRIGRLVTARRCSTSRTWTGWARRISPMTRGTIWRVLLRPSTSAGLSISIPSSAVAKRLK